jgi:ATP-dependent protease ClpP protease subunit
MDIDVLSDIGGWGVRANDIHLKLQGNKGQDLKIRVNSYGGEVFEGIAIYNLLKSYPGKKTTEILGYAMSMASVIALAGDEVTMNEHGYYMIHNPWMFTMGDGPELEKGAALLNSMTDELAKIYSDKTGLTVNRIKKMMNDETWLTPKEAKSLGFIDKIVKSGQSKFYASGKSQILDKYKNTPEDLISNNNKNNMNFLQKVAAHFGLGKDATEDQVMNLIKSQKEAMDKIDPSAFVSKEDFDNLQNSLNALKGAFDKLDLESLVTSDDLEGYAKADAVATKDDLSEFAKADAVASKGDFEQLQSDHKDLADKYAKAISDDGKYKGSGRQPHTKAETNFKKGIKEFK